MANPLHVLILKTMSDVLKSVPNKTEFNMRMRPKVSHFKEGRYVSFTWKGQEYWLAFVNPTNSHYGAPYESVAYTPLSNQIKQYINNERDKDDAVNTQPSLVWQHIAFGADSWPIYQNTPNVELADLKDADLTGMYFYSINFGKLDLGEAKLDGATFDKCYVMNTNCAKATMKNITLIDTKLFAPLITSVAATDELETLFGLICTVDDSGDIEAIKSSVRESFVKSYIMTDRTYKSVLASLKSKHIDMQRIGKEEIAKAIWTLLS